MATPTEVGLKLTQLVSSSSLDRVLHAMGGAAKKAAADAVKADLGSDLRMSGIRSKAKLTSGYDLERDGVVVHLRPKGLWVLADGGRRKQGTIRPRKKGGKKAVRVAPGKKGFRAYSHYTPSRGLGTVGDAVERMNRDVPIAAAKAMATNIGKL